MGMGMGGAGLRRKDKGNTAKIGLKLHHRERAGFIFYSHLCIARVYVWP